MPEGHLIHRYAMAHATGLRGPLTVSSPQQRFAATNLLDGKELEGVEPYGKHLFYWWAGGPILHVHLGLQGLFIDHAAPAPEARQQVRLRMAGAERVVDLIAPLRCETLNPAGREAITERLGSDPLRADADLEQVRRRLAGSGAAIGALLLDQSVIAGVGNVLRAEVLNIARVSPAWPARLLDEETVDRVWRILVAVMDRAAHEGRIITAGPDDPEARAALPEDEGRFVYRQERCRRCGTPVQQLTLGGRTIYACMTCQPRPPAAQPSRHQARRG